MNIRGYSSLRQVSRGLTSSKIKPRVSGACMDNASRLAVGRVQETGQLPSRFELWDGIEFLEGARKGIR